MLGSDFYSVSLLFFTLQIKDDQIVIEPALGGMALATPGLKRKAETPLASPPEPGQVLQDEPMIKAAIKSRVSHYS